MRATLLFSTCMHSLDFLQRCGTALLLARHPCSYSQGAALSFKVSPLVNVHGLSSPQRRDVAKMFQKESGDAAGKAKHGKMQ